MRNFQFVAGIAIAWGSFFWITQARAQAPYRLVDLASLYPTDINSSGQIVGNYAQGPFDYYRGLLMPDAYHAQPINLGFPNANGRHKVSINAIGQIVDGRDYRQDFWTPGEPNGATGFITSPYDAGINELEVSKVHDIGNDGTLIGTGWDFDHGGGYQSFLWKPSTANGAAGAFYIFGGGNGTNVELAAINNRGNIVGKDDNGVFLFVPTFPNGVAGVRQTLNFGSIGATGGATNINDVGQIVGATVVAGQFHATLWNPNSINGSSGVALDLGLLPGRLRSYAVDVNNAGMVVGWANDGSSLADGLNGLSFAWTPSGGMQNLADLLDASGEGWKLYSVSGINDRGQIIGVGLYDPDGDGGVPAVERGFVLNPVPEPTCLAALTSALCCWMPIRFLLRQRQATGGVV